MSMFLESVWIILWLVVLYHTPNFDSGDTILKKSGYQALNLDSLSTWPGRPLEGSSTMVLAIRGSPWGWGIMHMRKKNIYISVYTKIHASFQAVHPWISRHLTTFSVSGKSFSCNNHHLRYHDIPVPWPQVPTFLWFLWLSGTSSASAKPKAAVPPEAGEDMEPMAIACYGNIIQPEKEVPFFFCFMT